MLCDYKGDICQWYFQVKQEKLVLLAGIIHTRPVWSVSEVAVDRGTSEGYVENLIVSSTYPQANHLSKILLNFIENSVKF